MGQRGFGAFDAVSYARASAALGVPFKIAALGDSITANHHYAGPAGDQTYTASLASGWLHWAQMKDDRFFLDIGMNFGVGGNTTAQMLARVSDVIAAAPNLCFVQGGANDFSDITVTASTAVANLRLICQRLVAAGIRVVLIGVLPRAGNISGQLISLRRNWRDQVNQRLMRFPSEMPSVIYVDPDPALAAVETHEDTLAANATATTCTLGASASSVNDYYAGWVIVGRATSNEEAINRRSIVSYVGSTKVATLDDTAWPYGTPISGARYYAYSDGLPARGMMQETTAAGIGGLHPGPAGAKALGELLVTLVGPLMPPRPFGRVAPGGAYHATENPYGNLINNALFQSNVGTSSAPFTGGDTATGWQTAGSGASTGTKTATRADRTAGGKWQILTLAALTGGSNSENYSVALKSSGGVAVMQEGWLMQAGVEIDLTNLSLCVEASMQVSWSETGSITRRLVAMRNGAFRNSEANPYLPSGDLGTLTLVTPTRRVGPVTGGVAGFTFSVFLYLDASQVTNASGTIKIGNAWVRRVAES